MHELSIALSIVEGVEAEAKARGIPRVVAVHLKHGPLSGVVKEALFVLLFSGCGGHDRGRFSPGVSGLPGSHLLS